MNAVQYSKYKDIAAEALLLSEGGRFCANPACSSAFTLVDSATARMVTCPSCKVFFFERARMLSKSVRALDLDVPRV